MILLLKLGTHRNLEEPSHFIYEKLDPEKESKTTIESFGTGNKNSICWVTRRVNDFLVSVHVVFEKEIIFSLQYISIWRKS